MLKPKCLTDFELDVFSRDRLGEGLRILEAACNYAAQAGRPPSDYAVSLNALMTHGVFECDLMWLVSIAAIEHLIESTPARSKTRRFSTGGVSFRPKSCFVLTERGRKVSTELRQRILTESDTPLKKSAIRKMAIPRWDGCLRQLVFGATIIKRFRLPSPNQIAILAAFEEEGWPPRIDDPLPQSQDQEPKRRLHDTIRNLNRCHRLKLIRFQGDGTGQGILWNRVDVSLRK